MPNPRILLCGVTGQLGRTLWDRLPEVATVIPASSSAASAEIVWLDLARPDSIRQAVRTTEPDLIMNAAAYTAVDRAEQEPDLAHQINAIGPGVLAEEAARVGALLIHFSTDYVFNGSGSRPWSESDQPDPINVYGSSKLKGEEAIRASGAAAIILRTSWLFSHQGHNFVNTMLKLAQERTSLRIVNDQVGAPTSTRFLGDMLLHLLSADGDDAVANCHRHAGLYHLTCGGETSWHGCAREIFQIMRKQGCDLAIEEVEAIPTDEYPTPARRPLNSRLDCGKFELTFGISRRMWRDELEIVLREAKESQNER